MSLYKQQFNAARLGHVSNESQADEILNTQDNATLTRDDVIATQQDRLEVDVAEAMVASIKSDVASISEVSGATTLIADTATTAETISPVVTDSFVELANESLNIAGRILGTTLPKLELNGDGSVSDLSQEGLVDWAKAALPAVGNAAKQFFARMKLSYQQLGTSNKSMTQRLVRVRTKMGSRKGVGGKHVKLSSKVRAHLILGNDYSQDLLGDIDRTWALIEQYGDIAVEYEKRVAEYIRTRMMETIGKGRNVDFMARLEVSDLVAQMEKIANKQTLILGNLQLGVKSRHATGSITDYQFVDGQPSSEIMVRNLDLPKSLTQEQIAILIPGLQKHISETMLAIELASDQIDDSYSNLYEVLSKLNHVPEMDDPNYIHRSVTSNTANSAELLRLQQDVLEEVAEAGEMLCSIYSYFNRVLDSALELVEESLFQD